MTMYHVSINIDGIDMKERLLDSWGEAVRYAARISGYSEGTARRYLNSHVEGYGGQGDGEYLMPSKRDTNAGVWVRDHDPR